MAASLESLIDNEVEVITADGRVFVGTLKGFDHMLNLTLGHASERIFSAEEPVRVVLVGAYLIRGDDVVMIAELDAAKEALQNLDDARAEPIKPVVH